jgi:hypothetical protein
MAFDDLIHYGDKYTASIEAEFSREFSVDDYAASVVDEFFRPFQLDRDEDDECDMPWNEGGNEWENEQERERKKRSSNAYNYEFGNVYEANWFMKFLHTSVRERTHYLSLPDCYGEFRSLFCMPLKKIDDIVSLFFENE